MLTLPQDRQQLQQKQIPCGPCHCERVAQCSRLQGRHCCRLHAAFGSSSSRCCSATLLRFCPARCQTSYLHCPNRCRCYVLCCWRTQQQQLLPRHFVKVLLCPMPDHLPALPKQMSLLCCAPCCRQKPQQQVLLTYTLKRSINSCGLHTHSAMCQGVALHNASHQC